MEAAATNPMHVLLVEDDPMDEALVIQAFRKLNLGASVNVVRDGAEALDYLFGTGRYSGRDPQNLPRFVLMDIHLPKFSGIEVLDRIRGDPCCRYLPVIVFTSSVAERDLIECYRSGANSYVRKPLEFAGLVEAMRQIWQYWSALNEPAPLEIHLVSELEA